jgi:mycothiol S-conjugate amidase
MMAQHEAMLAAGLESPYTEAMERFSQRPNNDHLITTRVACGEYFEIRDDALRAHATQVDPDGFWFRIPLDIQRRVWPTEEYQLVRSLVDSELPEDDLFAGVRETVEAGVGSSTQ